MQRRGNKLFLKNSFINKIIKTIFKIVILVIFILMCSNFISYSQATTIIPTEDQQIEFKATQIKEINDTKQLLVEVWIKNLDFKGFDLRLQYDSNLLATSDVKTNQQIDVNESIDTPSCFEFANNFGNYMDLLAIEMTPGELRTIFSLIGIDQMTQTDEYLKNDEKIGNYISITGEVLLGTFSFKLGEGQLTQDTIRLKQASTSPTTGIKVNINGTDNYEDPSLFLFTLKVASDNANLADIKTNLIEVSNFDKDTLEYRLNLMEDASSIVITPIPEDEKANILVNGQPLENNGQTDNSGQTDGNNQTDDDQEGGQQEEIFPSIEVSLNALSEEDTTITILVTAEDGVTTKEYKLIIHKPYGTIKGSIYTEPTNTTTQKYIADIVIYQTSDTDEVINWDEAISNTNSGLKDELHQQLQEITPIIKQSTNDDGTYEILLTPGKYQLLIDKPGYLDVIYLNIEVTENKVIELDKQDLIAGDVNKNGVVELLDKTLMTKQNDKTQQDEDFNLSCDLNNNGTVELLDKTVLSKNNDQKRKIINYERGE